MNDFITKHYHIQADRPLIGLAPMRPYNDLPFRTICEEMGADFSVVAMSLDELDKRSVEDIRFPEGNKPKIVQLIGCDAKKMAEAATYYGENGIDIIDINLGRPTNGYSEGGSALLSDLSQVRELLSTVVKACPVPVTLKTRLGIDSEQVTAIAVAEIAQELGIKLMTIHGRTKAEGFTGKAQFEEVAKVKAAFPELAVLANGDISTPDKAKQVIEDTACDGVLIGRGAIGEPWLFSALRATLDYDFVVPQIDLSTVVLNHIRHIHTDNNHSDTGRLLAKKHIGHYLMGFGLEQQMMVFTDKDSEIEQIQKLSAVFPNVENQDQDNDYDNESAQLLPASTGKRTKKQIKEELFILYDEYHNVNSKYSGRKLEHKLHNIVDEMEKRQQELRQHSLLAKIKRLFIRN